MKILDGKATSKEIKEALKEEIKTFKTPPKIVDIQIGNNEASNIYIKNKETAATSIGILFETIRFNENTNEQTIIDKIEELNIDDKVNGILIQLPIPNHYNKQKLINTIIPTKDVDGLTYFNQAKLLNNEESLISCTPQGIIKLLEKYNITISGKSVILIGRSNLVGKPLISLFLNKNATVTICHSKTINLKKYTKQADILVVAVGHSHLITHDMVKDNAIVIDVGINRIDNRITGDVDYENVSPKCSYITPVPGGIGPMTIAMLLYNTIKSYKEQNFNTKIDDVENLHTIN